MGSKIPIGDWTDKGAKYVRSPALTQATDFLRSERFAAAASTTQPILEGVAAVWLGNSATSSTNLGVPLAVLGGYRSKITNSQRAIVDAGD